MGYIFLFLISIIIDSENFIAGEKIIDLLSVVILIIGCLKYFPVYNSKLYYIPVHSNLQKWAFLLFITLIIISFWRTNSFLHTFVNIFKSSIQVVLFPLLTYFVFLRKVKEEDFQVKDFIMILIHVLAFFCIMNLLSIMAKPIFGTSSATVLKLIGLNIKKLDFPLYENVHPNTIGSLGGYLVVLVAGFYANIKEKTKWQNLFLKFYILVGLAIVFIGDSRGTLFGTLASVIILYLLVKLKMYSILKLSIFVLPISHIIFILTLETVADTEAMSSIARNRSELATGNSRGFIYSTANNELADFKPIHLIGYGEYGIYGAGLTKHYIHHFGEMDVKKKLKISVAHNSAVQAIFDVGYLGLFIFLILLYTIFHYTQRFYKEGYRYNILFSYFLVYHIFIGITETNFGKYWKFPFFMFIYMAILALSECSYIHFKKKNLPALIPNINPASEKIHKESLVY
jgi:hypothetical protein